MQILPEAPDRKRGQHMHKEKEPCWQKKESHALFISDQWNANT